VQSKSSQGGANVYFDGVFDSRPTAISPCYFTATSARDRNRIEFKTDGKLTRKAQLILVGGWLVCSVIVIALLVMIGIRWNKTRLSVSFLSDRLRPRDLQPDLLKEAHKSEASGKIVAPGNMAP
jgi:hypothetical protein